MSGHESFEELCALAATGDLEPEELRRLGEHLYECDECRGSYRDFHTLVERVGTALEPERRARLSLPVFGAKRRFVARARGQGIAIEEPSLMTTRYGRKFVPAMITSFVLIGGLGALWQWNRSVVGREAQLVDRIGVLTSEISMLERRLAEKPGPAAVPAPTVVIGQGPGQDKEFGRLQTNYEAVVAAKTRLEENVSVLSMQLEQLRGDSDREHVEGERLQRELLNAQRELSNAQRELSNTQMRLTQTNQELASVRSVSSRDSATIAAQQVRLGDLAARIRDQSDIIERERQLLEAGKDIRDLMGARNLRIVDVEDVGTPGKQRPLAGRIFFTQGKSLIFYAYDLENRGNASRVAFQAWGKREGRSQAPRSLGVFYVDDSAQKRWVVRFEDRDVLAQIDQVFVTLEPPGGSTQPTTKPFLSAAFLNEPANHP